MKNTIHTTHIDSIQQDILALTSAALFPQADSAPALRGSGIAYSSEVPVTGKHITEAHITEALHQTVLPLIYTPATVLTPDTFSSDIISSDFMREKAPTHYNKIISNNIRVEYEHIELHELLSAHHIPYVILKGCASGYYYPDAILRTYGDVDFLIHECDIPAALELLSRLGFTPGDDTHGIHIGCHRALYSTWEMHRQINGIPAGHSRIEHYVSDIIDTAVEVQLSNGTIRIPDAFHHGLVLLLHTASHLTSEGIGLRHLCDWAVYAEQVDISQWKQQLTDCGLWRFAQVLSLVSVKYLHMQARPYYGTASDELLDSLMADIMNGGNFGQKDSLTRNGEIKYIKDRTQGTVSRTHALRHVFSTIRAKASAEHKSSLQVCFDYACLILSDKRKLDNHAMITEANNRKKLYSELHLFE